MGSSEKDGLSRNLFAKCEVHLRMPRSLEKDGQLKKSFAKLLWSSLTYHEKFRKNDGPPISSLKCREKFTKRSSKKFICEINAKFTYIWREVRKKMVRQQNLFVTKFTCVSCEFQKIVGPPRSSFAKLIWSSLAYHEKFRNKMMIHREVHLQIFLEVDLSDDAQPSDEKFICEFRWSSLLWRAKFTFVTREVEKWCRKWL